MHPAAFIRHGGGQNPDVRIVRQRQRFGVGRHFHGVGEQVGVGVSLVRPVRRVVVLLLEVARTGGVVIQVEAPVYPETTVSNSPGVGWFEDNGTKPLG